MRRILEILVFGLLATGLHLALFQGWDRARGVAASGDGGTDLISVEPATAALDGLVAHWGRAPASADQLPALEPPTAATDAPRLAARLPVTAAARVDIAQSSEVALHSSEPPPANRSIARLDPAPPHPTSRPAHRPRSPSTTARSERSAAGDGATGSAGQTSRTIPAEASTASEPSAILAWGARIQERLGNSAARLVPGGGGGTTLLILRVARDGRLLDLDLAKSSGNPMLDRAALDAAARAAPFPPAPDGISAPYHRYTVPIVRTPS